MRSPLALGAALVTAAGLATGLTSTPATGATVPTDLPALSAPAAFSPDGNGVRDHARIRLTLPRADRVTLQIRDRRRKVRVVHLGRRQAGEHVWRWDGRDGRGRALPDGQYRIRLRLGSPDPRRVEETVSLDTAFEAALSPAERYADPTSRPVRVFPRTRVVRDGIDLDVSGETEPLLRRVRLVVKDSGGRTVLQRRRARVRSHWQVRWTARRGGTALPPGDYRAFVRGTDRVGNSGRSEPVTIRVSGRRLVWREESWTFPAAEHRVGECTFSTANGCGDFPDYGEVLPSERYPGGLSLRSAQGPEEHRSRASASFYLPIPGTAGVRGVHSARVSLTGSPTVDGGSDPVQLGMSGTRVSGTSTVSTPWVTDLFLGQGADDWYPLPRFDPGVVWGAATVGTDSFDVATFTVDARYLVPEG